MWGGSDPSSFDCSGLTWYVYGQLGVSLPGGSAQQFNSSYGRYIGDMQALTPGDLVFFERTTEEAGITHVGIYVGDNMMIAARSERLGVRYVSLLDPFWSSRFVGGIRPYR
jgi:cell wall-associated NlpC family hydrolase